MSRDGQARPHIPPVQVAETRAGIVTYLVANGPEALPPVSARDLERAWYQARAAAIAARDGPARMFRFNRGDAGALGAEADAVTDLALTDSDARCWAEAVDAARGIDNLAGLSVCLRLLALVDLIGRERWASARVALRPDGAEIDAELLRAAAAAPLTREARFDAQPLRDLVSPLLPAPPVLPPSTPRRRQDRVRPTRQEPHA